MERRRRKGERDGEREADKLILATTIGSWRLLQETCSQGYQGD